MRRRRALILAVLTGLLILALAIGVAWLQPTGMPVPQYP
jgi:hypothetical protein